MTIRISQLGIQAGYFSDVAPVGTSLMGVVVAYQNPAQAMNTSGMQFSILGQIAPPPIRTSQMMTLALIRGRPENRRLRAWTYSLDGHDFYVLRLGEQATIVYDTLTQQWSQWETGNLSFWRAHIGMNWIGIGATSYINGAPTDIIAGDDATGRLWLLDPAQGYDEHPVEEGQIPFDRRVVGGIPMRMRETHKVGAVYLTASLGSPQLEGANITLRTSDDNGKTWLSHGTITVEPGNYDQEFVWRSLGVIKAPGRIFEITDDGASVRLDGLDMRDT